MRKTLIIARREYFKMVKSKGFWLTTLMIPALLVVISLISGFSEQSLETKLKDEANNAKEILVLDESGYINTELLIQSGQFKIAQSYELAEQAIKSGDADVFIYYPEELLSSGTIQIISQDKGIFTMGLYDEMAKNLIKQNILSEIKDANKIQLFSMQLNINTRLYNEGEEVSGGFDRFVLPIVSLIAYFLFTSVSTSYLLLSVSEEKENRMIEIVLSLIKPKDLIIGKVVGQMGAILTQIIVLVGLGALILNASNFALPIDLGQIDINPWQIVLALVYLLLGFLVLAFTMVAAGAAMPSYKEANGFSSVFIMMSVFPIYFFTFILAEPSGPLAIGLSYFPYTAPMILLLRNALGVLSSAEIVLSIVMLIISINLIAIVAYKMFEFGAMEYNQKVSFKEFFTTKFGRRKN